MSSAIVKEHAEKVGAKKKRIESLPDPLAAPRYARLRGKTIDWSHAAAWLGCSRKWVRHILGIRGIVGQKRPNYHGRVFENDLVYPADATSRASLILNAEAKIEIADADWFAAADLHDAILKVRGHPSADLDAPRGTAPSDAESWKRQKKETDCANILQAAGGRTRRPSDRFSNGLLNSRVPVQVAGFDLFRLAGVAADPSYVPGYLNLMAIAEAEVDEIAVEDVELGGFPFAVAPMR